MNTIRAMVLLTSISTLGACAQVLGAADTILTYKGQVTDTVIANTVEGAKRYCLLSEITRMEYREKTDLGNGPIIEVHCERISGPAA